MPGSDQNEDTPPSGDLKSGDTKEDHPDDGATTESKDHPEEDRPQDESPKKAATTATKKEGKFAYKDYSQVEAPPSQPGPMSPSAIRVQKLPAKLNAMLSHPEYQHILSWMPHGRSWKVHNPHLFVEEVIPKYFEYTNYNSFVRLVNAWGFRRLTKGPDRNSYYHELFLRGLPHLHSKMHRLTANEKKLPVDPEDEPDFYKISALCPLPAATHPSAIHKSLAMPIPHVAARNSLIQKQLLAANRGLGHMGGMMGSGGYHPADLAASRMGGMNSLMAAQLEQEEMALAAGMGAGGAGMFNSALSQQRAELIAANEAYELQAARLREQERRIAYLSGAAGSGLDNLHFPGSSVDRLGRGVGMLPEDMLGDPSRSLGQMPPSMMARLRESQQSKGGPYSANRF